MDINDEKSVIILNNKYLKAVKAEIACLKKANHFASLALNAEGSEGEKAAIELSEYHTSGHKEALKILQAYNARGLPEAAPKIARILGVCDHLVALATALKTEDFPGDEEGSNIVEAAAVLVAAMLTEKGELSAKNDYAIARQAYEIE